MMNNFLDELQELLVKNHSEDIHETIAYFREYIEDKKEAGEKEEDILNELGNPTDIVSELLGKKITKNNIQGLISNIDVDVKSYDIKIVTDDVTEIFVEKEDSEDILVETKDNTLFIKQLNEKEKSFVFNHRAQVIKLKLPVETHLDEVKVVSTSGDLEIEGDLYIENVKVRSLSGDIELQEVEINELCLNAKSGDIDIHDSRINQAKIQATSGDINLQDDTIDTCEIDVTSGDIDIDDLEVNDLNAKTLSGDVNLSLVGEASEYTIEENHKTYGNGEKNVKVSTLSGDIDIDF